MKKTFRVVVLLVAALVVQAAGPLAQAPELIDVVQVTEFNLEYRAATFGPVQRINLSDLNVWRGIVTGADPFRVYLPGSSDLKAELLRRGWASLRAPDAAPEAYRQAEAQAKSAQVGMWAISSQASSGSDERDWGTILRAAAQGFVWLLGAGIVAMVVKFAYTHWYIQRRVNLLLLGEPSTGKSAILERLLNPKVGREQILNLTMTTKIQRRRHSSFIPKGRFEIHPRLSDVPGAAFGSAWDEIIGGMWRTRPAVLLLVLAPTKVARVNGQSPIDDRYIYTQLGYVQAYIAGSLTSKHTRKPRVVMLFINKFDLIASASPTDTTSTNSVAQIRELFHEHIQVAETAARDASVPFRVLIGSALENWNCGAIIDETSQELYGFS